MRRLFAGLVLIFSACSYEPRRVFVPTESFEHKIEVSTAQGPQATVRVGERLVLHARRVTGPWKEVTRDGLSSDECWVVRPPEREEPEVADNVHWIVDPEGYATFNLGLRDDHTRTVQFSQSGQYRLRAVSKTWCGSPRTSGNITVSVVD